MCARARVYVCASALASLPCDPCAWLAPAHARPCRRRRRRCCRLPQSELAHQGESLLARIQQLSDTAEAINEDEGLLGWEVSRKAAWGYIHDYSSNEGAARNSSIGGGGCGYQPKL